MKRLTHVKYYRMKFSVLFFLFVMIMIICGCLKRKDSGNSKLINQKSHSLMLEQSDSSNLKNSFLIFFDTVAFEPEKFSPWKMPKIYFKKKTTLIDSNVVLVSIIHLTIGLENVNQTTSVYAIGVSPIKVKNFGGIIDSTSLSNVFEIYIKQKNLEGIGKIECLLCDTDILKDRVIEMYMTPDLTKMMSDDGIVKSVEEKNKKIIDHQLSGIISRPLKFYRDGYTGLYYN